MQEKQKGLTNYVFNLLLKSVQLPDGALHVAVDAVHHLKLHGILGSKALPAQELSFIEALLFWSWLLQLID
jgi:hypothetical protein